MKHESPHAVCAKLDWSWVWCEPGPSSSHSCSAIAKTQNTALLLRNEKVSVVAFGLHQAVRARALQRAKSNAKTALLVPTCAEKELS